MKGKQHTSTKQKQTEEQMPQRGFKEALVSDNEESEDQKNNPGSFLEVALW